MQLYVNAADQRPDQPGAALATYLGHVNVTHTYWYLTGIPELMTQAAARFERFSGQVEGGRP